MKQTITFLSFWGVFLLVGQLVQAQPMCLLPTNLQVISVTETSAELRWTSANVPLTEHCWNLEVGGAGFACGNGTAVVALTLCTDDTALTINGQEVTTTVSGLQAGTSYDWSLVETCDGIMPPFNTSGACTLAQGPLINTFDTPFQVSSPIINLADCPSNSPGFMPNASFSVEIKDASSCPGSTYDLTFVNGPFTLVPFQYLGIPAGTYPFFNAGPGTYTFAITELGPCNPAENPKDLAVDVAEAIDAIAPIWTISDVLGNVIVDNDPLTSAPDQFDFGLLVIPEGSCAFQQQLYATGLDDCDGIIIAAGAIDGTPTTLPEIVDPATQLTISTDNLGTYLLDINWSVGQSTIVFSGKDSNENEAILQLSANLIDNTNPSLSLLGAENVVIPFCESSITVPIQLQIVDQCTQVVGGNLLGDLDVAFNGSEVQTNIENSETGVVVYFEATLTASDNGSTWTASYEDPFGNIATLSQQISIEMAQEDRPPLIIAANENVSLNACQPALLVAYSASVEDDCSMIDPDAIIFDDGGSGLLLVEVVPSADGKKAMLQLEGTVSPGTYNLSITYLDSSVSPSIQVSQSVASPAVVQLPANTNFLLGLCAEELIVDFAISISDDCDSPINSGSAIFTLGNQTLTPNSIDQQAAISYFYFSVTLNAGNDGDVLRASYLDEDGFLTVQEQSIQLASTPDQWAPIITYPSQGINLSLAPCAPSTGGFTFFAQATDNCDGDLTIQVEATGLTITAIGNQEYLASGMPGVYTISLSATDMAGNTRVEDFEVEIEQAQAPAISFSCNDTINVTLNDACQTLITLDMALEGSLGCWSESDFDLLVLDSDVSNGAIADGVGTYPFTFTWNAPEAVTSFDGLLGPSAWNLSNVGDGTIVFGESLTIDLGGDDGTANAWFVFPYDGALNFSWDLNGPSTQGLGYLLAPDGTVLWDLESSIQGIFSDNQLPKGTIWILGMEGIEMGTLLLSDLSFTPSFATPPIACEGVIRLEDKTAPSIDCPADLSILTDNIDFYASPQGLNVTGVPVVADNCVTFSIDFEDQVEVFGDCGGVQISRTFTATDASANSSTCVQTITVDFPQITDLMLPQDTVVVACDIDYPTTTEGNPAPELTGFPSITVIDGTFDLNQTYANLSAVFSDGPQLVVCETSFVFLREWTISDWCNPSGTIIFSQIIKVGDFEAPIVACPFEGIAEFTTGPFSCAATFMVPEPLVSDACSSWSVLTEVIGMVDGEEMVFATILDGANRLVSGIPAGDHLLRFTVLDECGNESRIECPIRIVDRTNPVAICKEELNITLGGQGLAAISPEDINDSSEDNCGIDSWQIRRSFAPEVQECHSTTETYSAYADAIELNCCDAGQFVSVELLIVDESGNQSTCWTQVLVEDKRRPRCFPPNDVVVDCTELPYDFDANDTLQLQNLFGLPIITDNCSAQGEEFAPVVDLNDCGDGTILRSFRAIDDFGNSSIEICQQTINIQLVSKYKIRFPQDAIAQCGEPFIDTLSVQELGCDLLAVSTINDTFSISGLDCFKVLRTYRVIDWCTYTGAGEPIVVKRDEDCDGINGDEAVWVQVEPDGSVYYDRDDDFSNAIPNAFLKQTDCDGLTNPEGYWKSSDLDPSINSIGFWQYTQEIKVRDTVAPTTQFLIADPICALAEENCEAAIEELFVVNENCTPFDLRFNVFVDMYSDGTMDEDWSANEGVVIGVYPKYKVTGILPEGEHLIEIQIIDGCGNTGVLNMPLEVIDCKAPTPFCINGLTTALSVLAPGTDADGDGDEDLAANSIFVTDFLVSTPLDDCTNPVTYSINRIGEQASIDQDMLILTCDDPESVLVQIYAWDSAFNPYSIQPDGTIGGPNFDFCETYVSISNVNGPVCGISLRIDGAIYSELDYPVPGVEVQLNTPSIGEEFTDASGEFSFQSLEGGQDYTVIPYLDTNADQGVSTYDLVLITRHILGETPLDSPYKLIAADIDNSGYISVSDLIQLRELILSIQTSFSNNTSWRFIPADYIFPNADNPWETPFPELVSYNNLLGGQPNTDFIAIKIGDVTLDALTFGSAIVEPRAEETVQLFLSNQRLYPGQNYSIPIYSKQSFEGLQFALEGSSAIELVALRTPTAEWISGKSTLLQGRLLSSWVLKNGEHNSEKLPLFMLDILAKEACNLEDVLATNTQVLANEWSKGDESGPNIALVFSEKVQEEKAIYCFPTIVHDRTNLHISAESEGIGTITFFDISGKLVWQKQLPVRPGTQDIPLFLPPSLPSGMLFYKVNADSKVANGNIIVDK